MNAKPNPVLKAASTSKTLLLGWLLILLAGTIPAMAEAPPSAATLDAFRNLAGEWQGTNSHGETVRLSYEVVADGTAVLERFQAGGKHDMVTLYYLEDDRLMLTHYCVAGNRPRMRAVAAAGREIRFELADAAGLGSPEEGHMHGALFRFASPDHLESEWTWREKGEDVFTEVIRIERSARTASSR